MNYALPEANTEKLAKKMFDEYFGEYLKKSVAIPEKAREYRPLLGSCYHTRQTLITPPQMISHFLGA